MRRKRIVLGLLGFCAAALVAAQVYTVGGNTIEYSVANSGNRSNSVIINGVSTTVCSHNPGGGAIGVMYADHYDCLDTGDPPVVVNGLIYVTINLSSGMQEETCWEGWRQAQRNYEAATGRAPIPLPSSGCGEIFAYQVFNSAGQRVGQALTIGGPATQGPAIHAFETWRLPIPTPAVNVTPTPTPCYVEPQWMKIPCTTTPTPAPQVTGGTPPPTPVPNTSCPEPIRQLSDGGCACLGERVPCPVPVAPTTTATAVKPTDTPPAPEATETPTPTPTDVPVLSESTPIPAPTLTPTGPPVPPPPPWKPPGRKSGCASFTLSSVALIGGAFAAWRRRLRR